MALYEEITYAVTDIIEQYKLKVDDGKITLSEAWTMLYSATATLVQFVERYGGYSGAEKKEAVLQALGRVYDELIAPMNIQSIPDLIEPLVDQAIKTLMLTAVGAAIDSITSLLNRTGWLHTPKKPMGSPDRAELQSPERLDFPVF